jgi:antiphage defense system Thoeris ThsB-like protein
MGDTANVFISHIHEDDQYLARMKNLLARRGFDIRDSSINETRPNEAKSHEYIKYEILAPRIRWAGTVVVLISPETKDSAYVQWEIEYAQQHDTRVIGIFAPDADGCDLPAGLEDYADSIVPWDGDKLLTAIRGDDIWEDEQGRPRPAHDIVRHGC